jgi:hypothetical protein
VSAGGFETETPGSPDRLHASMSIASRNASLIT